MRWSFTWGHVRRLDAAVGEVLARGGPLMRVRAQIW